MRIQDPICTHTMREHKWERSGNRIWRIINGPDYTWSLLLQGKVTRSNLYPDWEVVFLVFSLLIFLFDCPYGKTENIMSKSDLITIRKNLLFPYKK